MYDARFEGETIAVMTTTNNRWYWYRMGGTSILPADQHNSLNVAGSATDMNGVKEEITKFFNPESEDVEAT